MKLALAFLPFAGAFAPITFGVRNQIALNAEKSTRPDTSKMVQEAMEAMSKFGATSKEARLAWEAVEEVDSSTRSSDAMALGVSNEECEVEEEPSPECIEYGEKLDELAKLIGETAPAVNKVKQVAQQVKAIKMKEVVMPAGENTPAVREALANAKKATNEFGADSTEAKLAWETLEEIASASEINDALGGRLDEECLTEMIEACEALEEIERVMKNA